MKKIRHLIITICFLTAISSEAATIGEVMTRVAKFSDHCKSFDDIAVAGIVTDKLNKKVSGLGTLLVNDALIAKKIGAAAVPATDASINVVRHVLLALDEMSFADPQLLGELMSKPDKSRQLMAKLFDIFEAKNINKIQFKSDVLCSEMDAVALAHCLTNKKLCDWDAAGDALVDPLEFLDMVKRCSGKTGVMSTTGKNLNYADGVNPDNGYVGLIKLMDTKSQSAMLGNFYEFRLADHFVKNNPDSLLSLRVRTKIDFGNGFTDMDLLLEQGGKILPVQAKTSARAWGTDSNSVHNFNKWVNSSLKHPAVNGFTNNILADITKIRIAMPVGTRLPDPILKYLAKPLGFVDDAVDEATQLTNTWNKLVSDGVIIQLAIKP